MNSVANEILDAAVDADQGDPRSRLRSKARAAGVLREVPAQRVDAARRRSALDGMRGVGPVLDDLLDDERDRP